MTLLSLLRYVKSRGTAGYSFLLRQPYCFGSPCWQRMCQGRTPKKKQSVPLSHCILWKNVVASWDYARTFDGSCSDLLTLCIHWQTSCERTTRMSGLRNATQPSLNLSFCWHSNLLSVTSIRLRSLKCAVMPAESILEENWSSAITRRSRWLHMRVGA